MSEMRAPRASESELYAADEVELLLDEIRHLEPTSCPPEELQDFEIAGSGCGSVAGGAGAGARSPARTEASWDSHAQYRAPPPPAPRALARCYCAPTRHHVAPAVILVCSGVALTLVWAALGPRLLVPLRGRAAAAAFGALSSLLLHAALLAARVTRLAALLPLRWDLVLAATSAWSALWLAGGSSALLLTVLFAPQYRYTPHHIAVLLYVSVSFSLLGALVSLVLALAAARRLLARHRALRPPL